MLAIRALAVLIGLALCVRGGEPRVKGTGFKHRPGRMFYFEDTTVILYHDTTENTIFRSSDEGLSWSPISGVPPGGATYMYQHPHDNRIAFILSPDLEHFRTSNRGETWQSWKSPVVPAMNAAPLVFHAQKEGWILFQGIQCSKSTDGWWGGQECHDQTFYTLDAFETAPKLLLDHTFRCAWAHGTKEFSSHAPDELVFCIAFDQQKKASRALRDLRIFSSDKFFQDGDRKLVDLGIGMQARGVIGIGVVNRYIVTAVKDPEDSSREMSLFVTIDGINWHRGIFPHGHSDLKENAYTLVEATGHSLLIDVLMQNQAAVGTLFTSNPNGTFFVPALKNTNRNSRGLVDFEQLVNVQGVAFANIVLNPESVEAGLEEKKLSSRGTWDDGSSWLPLSPPAGGPERCSNPDTCFLNLHSVTSPHNIGTTFSSRAPGYVMGVGSVGTQLALYDESNTYLSTDAGVTWKQVREEACLYEFGDQGSVLVIVGDEGPVDHVSYSFDDGKSWQDLSLGKSMRVQFITSVPDSTSQKFVLLGALARADVVNDEKYLLVHLDFEPVRENKCKETDLEKWYPKTPSGAEECLMGHQQWYKRRKIGLTCFHGNKFEEAIGSEDSCECTEEDYECDFNFVRENGECKAAGPEVLPEGTCADGTKGQYRGSSGYRKIPGNSCTGGVTLDKPIMKDCSKAAPSGSVTQQRFVFPSVIESIDYFTSDDDSMPQTILVQLRDATVWMSSNEGYSWARVKETEEFLGIVMHSFALDRAYLLGAENKMTYTIDAGKTWSQFETPLPVNGLSITPLQFHPKNPDWLIFTGSEDCDSDVSQSCKAVAYYSRDNGARWRKIDDYVNTCKWARDKSFKVDERIIICESYKDKKGNQKSFDASSNSLQLVSGTSFYSKKQVLIPRVVGFATFETYFVAAELSEDSSSLDLQVSVDAQNFAKGLFPPNLRLDNGAYTILESVTAAIFLHVTTNSVGGSEWGSLLKSNSNGTFYGLSLEFANRNEQGYVDFEKMIGLDGVAVANIVGNHDEASVHGRKDLRSKITHNDGGSWEDLTPPAVDSLGQPYDCVDTACSLHIHGYTERRDSRATYSSPSAVGLMMAVGNVGKKLAKYDDSDTFLTRNGGFTWEEVHKDAHLWEFGDSGSIIVLANDEDATDHIMYTTDEGLNWKEHKIGEKIRIESIKTVPSDLSRKFILIGQSKSHKSKSVVIFVDFTGLSNRKCSLDIANPDKDDYELWSPSEERKEHCLFGRTTMYHRRIRDRNCYVGQKLIQPQQIVENCTCSTADFEWNAAGECVLQPGTSPLVATAEDFCPLDEGLESWFERTAYRKIPFSTCDGGKRLDHGLQHSCPGLYGHSILFWLMLLLIPVGCAVLGAISWMRRKQSAIRLDDRGILDDGGLVDTIATLPYFIVGVTATLWARIMELRIFNRTSEHRRGGYRNLAAGEEDAAVLNWE